MLAFRFAKLAFGASFLGFVLCSSFVGGCSLFGGDDGSGGSSSSSSSGGGGDVGGSAGSGGTNSTSSSSGMPVTCTDHTTLNEANCSLLKQDCTAPGTMCVPDGSGTKCVFETGIKGVGASCSGIDSTECAAGLTCVFLTCAPFCCPNQPQPFCGSAKCNVNVNFGGGTAWACNLAKSCTLFGNDCPENQQCRLGDPDQELSLCAPSSDMPAAEGGMCGFLNDCGANQVCTGEVCRYSCLLADWQSKAPGEGGCPPMQTCVPGSMNSVQYGNCMP